jgi:hypothetical protein
VITLIVDVDIEAEKGGEEGASTASTSRDGTHGKIVFFVIGDLYIDIPIYSRQLKCKKFIGVHIKTVNSIEQSLWYSRRR